MRGAVVLAAAGALSIVAGGALTAGGAALPEIDLADDGTGVAKHAAAAAVELNRVVVHPEDPALGRDDDLLVPGEHVAEAVAPGPAAVRQAPQDARLGAAQACTACS